MPAPHPRMHGLSHVVGGPDPVPGLLPSPGGPIDEWYKIPGAGLQYWYRLGEPGPWPTDAMLTADFALDSSGNDNHLSAANHNNSSTAVLVGPGDAHLPACDVLGALEGGSDNDGGIQFNWNEYQWIVWGHQLCLVGGFPGIETPMLEAGDIADGTGSTFAAWVAFQPPGGPGFDNFAPYESDGTDPGVPGDPGLELPLISTMHRTFGIGSYGVRIGFYGASGQLFYSAAPGGSGGVGYSWVSPFGFVPGQWYHFAASIAKLATDSYRRRVYVNGNPLVEITGDAATVGLSAGGVNLSIGGGNFDDIRWAHCRGKADEVAMWASELTQVQISGIYTARGEGGEGWIIGLDEDGNPSWQPPPSLDVTVNGDEQTSSSTPVPTPASPPDPPDSHPGDADWIEDQPFLYGGGDFTVQPNTWTTIPFTFPLMQRLSNSTPSGFGPLELDDDDPDSAGWVSDASEYTRKAIVIPHDMPFLAGSDWMQVCLKLEDPAVQASTSYRALRIFETTRQKTLIMARELRTLACTEGGAVNVYREDAAHALASDGFIFAEGDTGSTGSHGNIMIVPNAGYAYYLNGEDWLPRVAGVPTLKEGMRLVAQAWHDASTALTFSATSPFPYRPHFVIRQTMQRSWGEPWSEWPLA